MLYCRFFCSFCLCVFLVVLCNNSIALVHPVVLGSGWELGSVSACGRGLVFRVAAFATVLFYTIQSTGPQCGPRMWPWRPLTNKPHQKQTWVHRKAHGTSSSRHSDGRCSECVAYSDLHNKILSLSLPPAPRSPSSCLSAPSPALFVHVSWRIIFWLDRARALKTCSQRSIQSFPNLLITK